MGLYDELMALRKKQEREEAAKNMGSKKTTPSRSSSSGRSVNTTSVSTGSGSPLLDELLQIRATQKEENIAPVRTRVTSRMTVGDIAPTKKKKDEDKWYQGWFQKGALDDGYDFGDVTRVILGTTADLGQDLTQGALGIVEKGIDFLTVNAGNITKGMYYQNGGGYNVEQDRMFEESLKASQPLMENFAKKDIINEEKISRAIISGDYEKQSVLGEKADQTVQSGGQLLATAGLQAVGVPWWLTTGVTAWGAEAENALNQGATMEEANLSGAISAGAEILTEKISGGIKFGGKALDDATTDYLSRAISNKFARNALKFGLDATGEGFEEILSQDISSFGQWLTYRDEEELKELLGSEEAMDEKIQAFIGGALMGGVSNVGNAIKSSRQGVDSVTGRTNNEEAVVRKVYDDLVAEAQKDGKVTAKEKTKIYDDVVRKLEKGYISTDVIEELFDEEGYKAFQAEKDNFTKNTKKSYNDAIISEAEQVKQLQEELDKLTEAPGTVGNIKRYDEIVSQITELTENPQSNNLKAHLDQEVIRINEMKNQMHDRVRDMVKGTKLEESYNELIRSRQKFTADVSQYKNEHARKTVQNIIDSGVAVNTNEMHDFVDWLTQISESRGMTFSLTDSKQLEGTAHPANTQGFIDENGNVTLNIEADDGAKTVVGHEITHPLENTEHYQALQDSIFEYAKAKYGEEKFNERLKTYEKLYKGMKNTTPEKELTAQLLGEHVCTDQEFISSLCRKDRNLFQKIFDEIKYLFKIATAGSKQARMLEQTKKMFEHAWQESSSAKADTNTKHSLSSNIKDTSTGYASGESYYTMSYEQDGKVVATLEYGEYDGNPNVKMIEVDPEYRRKGIATKLMQELQNKYPDTEINFGMATPDGSKLLDSITYDVTDEAVVADRQKLKNLQTELDELQGKLDTLFEIENLTDEQHAELEKLGDRWQEVYEDIIKLDKELRGKKATRTFVKTDAKYSLSDLTFEDIDKLTDEELEQAWKELGLGNYLELEIDDSILLDDDFSIEDISEETDVEPEIIKILYRRNGLGDSHVEDNHKAVMTQERINQRIAEHGATTPDYARRYITRISPKDFIDMTVYERNMNRNNFDTRVRGDLDSRMGEWDYEKALRDSEEPPYLSIDMSTGQIIGHNGRHRMRALEMAGIESVEIEVEFHDEDGRLIKYDSKTIPDMVISSQFDTAIETHISNIIPFNNAHRNEIIRHYGEKAHSNAGVKYSLSESDNAYFDAVTNNDWETAERMVDEAAKKAGYTKAVYHGTDARFTVFDTDEESTAREQHAWMADYPDGTIFLAEDYEVADGYGDRVMELYLDTTDMKVFEEPDMYAHRAMDDMYGYEVYNYPVIAVKGKDMTIYATLDNTLVKSADTVTFGDGGEIISLSERFKHSNEDIRYSLSEDSEGRKLSENQEKYFAGSKVTDENGKLKAVYHGSPADFNTFSLKYLGTNGTAEGYGFYFTDKKSIAEGYSKGHEGQQNGKPGKLFECYLDIKKPLSDTEVTMTRAQFKKFLTTLNQQVDADGEPLDVLSNYGDVEWEGLNKVLNYAMEIEYDGSDSDVNLVHSIINGCGNMEVVFDVLRKTVGYDGIIVDEASWGGDQTIYIAFHPEQIKNIDNLNPTTNLDIRYSLSEDSERVFYTPRGVEVVQNPTNAEYRQMREEIYKEYPWLRGTGEAILRHTYDEAGNEYYWNAFEGMHRDVEPYINKQYNTRTSQHWEWWTREDKDDYPTDYSYLQNSLSDTNRKPKQYINGDVPLNKFKYDPSPEFAPVIPSPNRQSILPGERMSVAEMFPDEPDISQAEYDNLLAVKDAMETRMTELAESADFNNPDVVSEFEKVNEEWVEANTRLLELENELSDSDRVDSLMDAEAPPEMDAPYYESEPTTLTKKATADIVRDVRASLGLTNNQMADAKNIIERYRSGEIQSRDQLVDALQDKFGTYKETKTDERLAEVKKAIRSYRINVSDDIKHGIADYAKLMRSMRGKMLFAKDGLAVDEAYKDLQHDFPDFFDEDANGVPENQFRQMVDIANTPHTEVVENNKNIEDIEATADLIINGIGDFKRNQDLALSNKESKQAFESLVRQGDKYAPMDDIAPVKPVAKTATTKATVSKTESVAPVKQKTQQSGKVAQVHTAEPKTQKRKGKAWSWAKEHFLDKGMVFEDLSKKTGNRKLEAKWNFIRNSGARAQRLIGKGAKGVKALTDIRKQVEKSGKTDKFYSYMYHVHNIDRMTLADRFKGTPNKAVFGDTVTADISRKKAAQMEKQNPEFKRWANDIYKFNKHLRNLLVEGGVISQEVANLWEKMYPHYVPIRRDGDTGLNINVPLDSNKTGINAPVKRATGGSSDILPLFDTMAMRAEQTYRAIAKNNFGIELKNMLGSTIANEAQTVDGVIDSLDSDEALLKPGTNGMSPTFTVFENGERVEFEITDEMYEAMKPANDFFASTSKFLNGISNFRRGTLTEYNPWFMLKNAIKDQQDVILNSQHPVKTYANMPVAIAEMVSGGDYYQEYLEAGGEQNTYFDTESNTFDKNKVWEAIKWATGLNEIAWANNKIEMLPRLAEYIASRKEGRSVEVSMLDAARVTTNFAAGGDVTKWANRNGVTFLNASVQGAIQQVRNVREAKQNGVKGVLGLAAKYLAAGLPAVLLNNLLWEDDEEYEELADYVKRDYYVVGKFGDGKFVRIPKGRGVAVIQYAMERMDDLRTGDDEADMKTFLDIAWDTLMLAKDNVAPNNPLDNNVISPVTQVLSNKTWYGEEMIPSRLQDVPAAEQYDESTDDISRWIGEKTNTSPIKWNYLIDQYSGVLGDTFLPMLTPEAESGDDTTLGTITAPLRDMFTTDSVINNQISSDFYDTKDLVDIAANSSNATDEDKMKSTYMQTVGWELSDLYAQKREIQNSNMADSAKYKQSRDIQKQINEIMENAMGGYEDVSINGLYSEVGDKRFNQDKESGKWYEIKPKNADGSDNWYYQMEQDVTKALGISYGEYWNNREEYNYAYEKPEQYTVAKAVGGYESYRKYTSYLYDLKADKDENGESISGSKKKKVFNYINNLPIGYGEKIILFRSMYDSKADKEAYNADIVEYLNSRDDISYQDMETILKYLDFEVDSEGNISW